MRLPPAHNDIICGKVHFHVSIVEKWIELLRSVSCVIDTTSQWHLLTMCLNSWTSFFVLFSDGHIKLFIIEWTDRSGKSYYLSSYVFAKKRWVLSGKDPASLY